MYDILLRNGTVIDPANNLNAVRDLAVENGVIAAVDTGIDPAQARTVIDVAGRVVIPGMIDPHTHVYSGFTRLGIDPDLGGVYAGVTTLADGGSVGALTVGGFTQHIAPHKKTDVFLYLNVARAGMASMPEVTEKTDVDVDVLIEAIKDNPGVVKGVKLRMVSPALDVIGLDGIKGAFRAVRETGTNIMVHIGQHGATYDPNLVREMLNLMQEGDILTHIYCDEHGSLEGPDGKLLPEALAARDRGVWMDIGHGTGHFTFAQAAKWIDQGLKPQMISTDLTITNRTRLVYGLVHMMTKAMAMGFSLEEVVPMVTTNPAKALKEDHRIGTLGVGRQADVSVLDVREGNWTVYDTQQKPLPAKRCVVPALTLKRGEPFYPEWGPRPWGWEPDPA